MSGNPENPLQFLYSTVVGRCILKLLTARWLSRIAGSFCDSALSKPLIGPFLRNNAIDLTEYEETNYRSFNDCFTRKIRAELRPVSQNGDVLISPCDGLLSAYHIHSGTVLPAKQSAYTVASLLRDPQLAKEFEDGIALVIRLCVHHYHRYCYIDSGAKGENVFIPGKLHTVRPIALEHRAVFCENSREYTVMETAHFGKVVQCEVGAMLVGRIANHDGACRYKKGQEKGVFQYGGSTIILLFQTGAVTMPEGYFNRTRDNIETPVKYGEQIGLQNNCK